MTIKLTERSLQSKLLYWADIYSSSPGADAVMRDAAERLDEAGAIIQLLARDGVRASAEEWERIKPWLQDDARQKPASAAELAARHGFREHGGQAAALAQESNEVKR
jgi:hypothetical protein